MSDSRNYIHISAKKPALDLRLSEIRAYKDLIFLYARRSLVTTYKQTILGPAWMVINPFVTSVVHMIVFGKIAGLSTDGIPQMVFYLMGTACWGFFSSTFSQCTDTFLANSYLYGKVYFPRLTIPLSNILVSLVQFGIQFAFGCCFMLYYYLKEGVVFTVLHWPLILLVLLWLALCGYGFGILASSMTTRYRDIRAVVMFALRLWMYITPVVYPLTQLPAGYIRFFAYLNPVTAPSEIMRWCLWGRTALPAWNIVYSLIVSLAAAFLGTIAFNRVERTFMDTV